MVYKSEYDATQYRRMINALRVARAKLQKEGAFESISGLQPEHETWVSGYSNGTPLTNFEAILADEIAKRNKIQAALGSAIGRLESKLADLEL